jgi:hypothetical protein
MQSARPVAESMFGVTRVRPRRAMSPEAIARPSLVYACLSLPRLSDAVTGEEATSGAE